MPIVWDAVDWSWMLPPRVIELPLMTKAPALLLNVIPVIKRPGARSFRFDNPRAPSNTRLSPAAGAIGLPSQLAAVDQLELAPPPSQVRTIPEVNPVVPRFSCA